MKFLIVVWMCFRMPAILDGEEEVRRWLDFGQVKPLDAVKLLQSKNILNFHPVSSIVNNSRNNSPECLQPVDLNSKKVHDLMWHLLTVVESFSYVMSVIWHLERFDLINLDP